jgi:ATP-dependent RNA helicase DeaD
MLRMGFIDDVEWILEQLPKERQVVLFSGNDASRDPSLVEALSQRSS